MLRDLRTAPAIFLAAGLMLTQAPAAAGQAQQNDVDAAPAYVVVGLDEDRLKPLEGQRVALTGQFEPPVASVTQDGTPAEDAAVPSPTGTSGSDRWPPDLPRFRATSVKPVPGICTPKP